MSGAAEDVPFVDLVAQHHEVADRVAVGFARVMAATAFIGGTDVAEFEQSWAAFTQSRHAIGVSSGTDALELALRAAGLAPGDEVVLPTNSFVASAEAVVRAGGRPVLVDCDEDSFLMDTAATADALRSRRPRFVMPVHLFGQLAPMEELARLAMDSGAEIVEDAAQAHGATYHGSSAGAWGAAAAWSFYPGKNLGAYGEAGAVTTNDDALAAGVGSLRNHGGVHKYEHRTLGFNSRLDTLQAVVLLAKLQRLEEWNAARRAAADGYARLLGGQAGVILPKTQPGNVHVWHLYVVRVPDRDRVLDHLSRAGIQAGIHYPKPIHLLDAFSYLGHCPGDFPVAERLAQDMLSLPMHPHLSAAQQERVAETMVAAL